MENVLISLLAGIVTIALGVLLPLAGAWIVVKLEKWANPEPVDWGIP